MGLFGSILNIFSGGRVSLQQATESAPNAMGCYKLYCDGNLVYVGKAEDGIRKRFVQYYHGTTAHYTSAIRIFENRDKITVSWKVLSSKEECRTTEAYWIKEYNPSWNKQSGWGGY